MERYVFETAREMANRGHDVTALCRTADPEETSRIGVKTIMLRPKPAKHGWEDRAHFNAAVSSFFRENPKARTFDIIHSHENTVEQHVSTEHGPCTLEGLRRAPWKFFDYSALRNLILERAKFGSKSLSALTSCSAQVEKTVLNAYPQLRRKLCAVIPPAYSYLASADPTTSTGFTLGFMGADWKRKGLPKALEIFTSLRRRDPRWSMVVAGVEPSCLPSKLFSRLPDGVSLAGRVDPTEFFTTIDLLLHPAREEPFGMVITESLSKGVPAVISERCGCAEHLQAEGLRIVDHNKSADHWASACSDMHGEQAQLISQRTWTDVAVEHECLYDRVLSARQARVA